MMADKIIEMIEMLDISPLGKNRIIYEVTATDSTNSFFDLKGRFLNKQQAIDCKTYWENEYRNSK